MHFPIFHSIINKIRVELQSRGIEPTNFKEWNDLSINATGLELVLDVSRYNTGIKEVVINFDWDSFREVKLAKNLKGMEKHPLIQNSTLMASRIAPSIDVEILWKFDEEFISGSVKEAVNYSSTDYASAWMNAINEALNSMIPVDKIITRWHLEIDGNTKNRVVSSMNLISYVQYSLNNMTDINEIHQLVHTKLASILDMSAKVLSLAKKTKPIIAA